MDARSSRPGSRRGPGRTSRPTSSTLPRGEQGPQIPSSIPRFTAIFQLKCRLPLSYTPVTEEGQDLTETICTFARLSRVCMLHILIIITPLFLIIFASALFQRARNLGEEWISVLNEYALKIGLPILIFSSLSKARFSFAEQAPLLLANSLLLIGTFFVFAAVLKPFKMPEKKYKTILICLMFSNVAYLGIPVLSQLYGETILPTTSLIIAVHVFWFFTLGIGYLDFLRHSSSESIFKDIAMGLVKNPLLISVALGILVAATRIVVPDVLMIATDMVSASVTPTVLIVVGLFIGRSTIGSFRAWIPVFVFSLATLTVIPGLFYLSIRLADANAYWVAPSLIESAMPLAITPFALADTYELDKEFIARSIVLSTIVAVLTLPFWISLVQ